METPKFKYWDAIAKSNCGVCPPNARQDLSNGLTAYRYGCDQRLAHTDFIPRAVQDPSRELSPAHKQCSGFGLSYFMSQTDAETKWRKLQKQGSKFCTIHPYFFETMLTSEDGVATAPDRQGHFDFHEFSQTDLLSKSKFGGGFS